MWKWSAGLGLLMSAAASCGTDSVVTESSPATTGSGDGFEFEILGPDSEWEWLEGPAPGELSLDGCRWVGPGAYEFDLSWRSDETGAVELPVWLDLLVPASDQDIGARVQLRLVGSASFTIPVDVSWQYEREDEDRWYFSRVEAVRETSARCGGSIYGSDSSWSDADLSLAPVASSTTGQDPLEEISREIDPLDPDDPLLPLAWMAPAVSSLVDSYAVVDDARLDSVRVERVGTCVTIFSAFTLADGSTVHLLQRGGCSTAPPSDQVAYPGFVPPAVVDGGAWTVTVTPGSADIVWLGETAAPSEEATTETPPAFSPSAWLGAYREQHPDLDVLAVFEWQEGLVAAVDSHQIEVERYSDPIVITPEQFLGGGGGSGTVCDSWGYYVSSQPGRSFIILVAHESGLHFELDSVQLDSDDPRWLTAPDGRDVGFADLNGSNLAGQPHVTDASGTAVPCKTGSVDEPNP